MTLLHTKIERELARGGADLVGFADVRFLSDAVTGGLPRAISIGVALNPAVVRAIACGPTQPYFAEYTRANGLLAELCERAAGMLRSAGKQADPIVATTEHFDPVTLSTRLQHKTIATRAGLGWIGKSALLVTSQYGCAVRLASVLTDAELETGDPVETSHCGSCQRCVAHCPAGAIVGKNWAVGMARETLYSAAACRATAQRLAAQKGIDATICGMCINACPWTQRYIARESTEPVVEIASAGPDDLKTVRELFREYEACLPFDLSFQDFESELAGLPGRYAPPTGRMLLAKRGGATVGCVALRQIGEGICEMKRLYVRPASRGRGFGRALANAIIEEGRKIGYKRMRLDTVLKPAKCLYRSLGFREIPPYQHVPLEGIVFMELNLQQESSG